MADDCERADAIQQLQALLNMCRGHLKHENDFVHPAIEKALPGATARISREHVEHEQEIDHLEALVSVLQSAPPAERTALARRIYRELSLFVADNFEHMVSEETDHHRALIEAYSDAEVLAIEHAIVASLSPEESFAGLRWMIPQINASERALLARRYEARRSAGGIQARDRARARGPSVSGISTNSKRRWPETSDAALTRPTASSAARRADENVRGRCSRARFRDSVPRAFVSAESVALRDCSRDLVVAVPDRVATRDS